MKLNELSFDKLVSLYGIISEICQDYSRLTDGYSLATGDNKFESMPEDIRNMINERQRFFSYRNRVKEMLKSSITNLMENDKQD